MQILEESGHNAIQIQCPTVTIAQCSILPTAIDLRQSGQPQTLNQGTPITANKVPSYQYELTNRNNSRVMNHKQQVGFSKDSFRKGKDNFYLFTIG